MKDMFEVLRKVSSELGLELYLFIASFLGAWLKVKNGDGTWIKKGIEIITSVSISVLTTPALAQLFEVESTQIIAMIAVMSSYAGISLVDEIKKRIFRKVEEIDDLTKIK